MAALVSLVLWTVGLTYYAAFVVCALALTFVLPPRALDPALKAAMRGVFRLLFVRVEVRGLEHLPADRPVVFCPSPHCSMLDIPLVAGFLPGPVRGVYAAGLHRWPLYGWLMRRLGNIPVPRDDVHGSVRAMAGAGAILDAGASLVIFPEGHRTTTGAMLPFKKLPFHVAREVGRPVVPVAVHGMFAVNNKASWHLRPGTVRLELGDAIDADTVMELSVLELRSLVESRVRAMMGAGQG